MPIDHSSSPATVPLTVPATTIASFTGLTARRIEEMAREKKIPAPESKGNFLFRESVLAICTMKAPKAEAILADKARKERADADLAEMKAAKEKGTLCLRSDYSANYADAIAQGVQKIARLESLSASQKEDVLSALRSVRLPDIEENL